MRFDKRLKVIGLCLITLVSNLVLAAESRIANRVGKTHTKQLDREQPKSVESSQSVVQKPEVNAPDVPRELPEKPEIIPVEKVRPLEMNRVRG